MRIAVSSTGPGLDADIDPRFGRCNYFVIVDTDTMEFEAVENPNVMAAGGAGIQSAQLVAEKRAGVVLTGSCGPNAFQTLQAAGVKVCDGITGTVRDAAERYKKGELAPSSGASVASKFGMMGGAAGGAGGGMGLGMGGGMGRGMGGGMGGGMGRGGGRGMGRGMGGGMGRGMGGGMGTGFGGVAGWGPGVGSAGGMGMTPGFGWPGNPVDEIAMLKAQADGLKAQLDRIRQRIEEIEKGTKK